MESREIGGVRIALPPTSADVELQDLRDTEDHALTIRCRRVPAELVIAAYGLVPAEHPKSGIEKPEENGHPKDLSGEDAARALAVVERARPALEAGCTLVLPDQTEARIFGPNLIPTEALSITDAGLLFSAVSSLSGVRAGAEASPLIRFRYEYGAGVGSGDGAGRPGGEVRDEAVEPA